MIFGILSFIISLYIYLLTLCPTVYVGDGGELIGGAYSLGIPHPPGYPLYCLVAKLFTILFPFANIAYRVTLSSAICGSLTVLVFYFILNEILVSIKMEKGIIFESIILLGGAVFTGFMKTCWDQVVESEVYALNAFMVFTTILFFIKWIKEEKIEYMYITSCIAGIGLANHLTMSLVIFSFLIFIILFHYKFLLKYKYLQFILLIGALMIFLYSYMPIRSLSNPELNWGHPDNITKVLDHMFRRQYGRISGARTFSRFFGQVHEYLKMVIDQFPSFLLIFIPFGIFNMRKNKQILVLTIILFLSLGVGFIFALNFERIPLLIMAVEVFFIPSFMILGIWISFGVLEIYRYIIKTQAFIPQFSLCLLFSAILIGSPIFKNYYENDRSRNIIAYECAWNILRTIEKNSVIFGIGDDIVFPMAYLMKVEGRRNDITGYDDLGCVYDNIYDNMEFRKEAFNYFKPPIPFDEIPFLKHNSRDREIIGQTIQKYIVHKHKGPVYHVLGSTLANTPGIRRITIGILHRVIKENENEKNFTILNPWRHYRMREIDDRTIHKDYLTRDIICQYYFFLGDYFYAKGNEKESDKNYDKGVEVGWDIDWVRNNTTIIYNQRGKFYKSIDIAKKAVEINPTNADAWNNLGIAYFHIKDYDKAIEAYQKAVDLNPGYAKAYNNMANAYLSKGMFKEAIQRYQWAISIDPGYAEAYANMGIAYFNMRNYDAAIQSYMNAIRIIPQYADAWCNMGVAYQHKGDLYNAEASLRRAIMINPNHITARFNLALTCYSMKKFDEAIKELQEILKIDPNHSQARVILAKILSERK